jgi:hypothetical protein
MKKDYGLTRHHRRPRSKGGNGKPENISVVPETKHRAWHVLFADKNPDHIAEIINAVWLDPHFKFICVRKEK